jgi:hypothetical protein
VVTACFGLIGINRFDTEWRRPGIYSRIGQSQRERRTLSRVAIREGVEPRTAPGQQPSPEGASQPHRVPIELTFTRRGGRHLTRPRARCQKGSETLEVSSSSPVYRSRQPNPLDDSDRLGAPALCRPKGSSPPTGPNPQFHEEIGRVGPNSRVLSDTSREVRYLSTRPAR